MRLLYKETRYLNYSRRKARRELKRRLKESKRKKVARKEVKGMSTRQAHQWHTKRRYKAIVKAPAECAFLRNPDSVAEFIRRLETAVDTSPSLYVEMGAVENIDYATIASLLAVLYIARKRGKKINGSMPKAEEARLVLVKSGFIYTLFSNKPEVGHRYEINADNQLFTLDQRDLGVVSEIQDTVSKNLLGEKKKLPGLYTTLGELMDNTATHAAEENGAAERWWISINYDRQSGKVEFVFIDYGVGIFSSLLGKVGEHPVKNILQRAQKAFGADATDAHLKAIVTESARKVYKLPDGRGEGIYGIYQAVQRGEIDDLYIISNNAFGAVSSNSYIRLKNQLRGTLYYWSVCDKNCK